MGLTFIMMLAFGAFTGYLAKRQGKNPYLWFILGILFGIFGIFFLFFQPSSAKKQAKSSDQPTTIDIAPTINPIHKEKFWYYLDPQNQQFGPMSFDALKRAWNEGKVTRETYVWNESLEQWIHFGECIQSPNPIS